jgi:capsular exopolysaccharide synthesis family protein
MTPATSTTLFRDGWLARVRVTTRELLPGSPLFPFNGRDSRSLEQYRIIRTKILQYQRSLRLLAVSSPQSGDGKSVTAANVAGALALKTEASVLLIDADFRRSALAALLNVAPGPGLVEVLGGECSLEDAVVQVRYADLTLHFLPAGTRPMNPAELLASSRWAQACAEIRRQFDYAVIDTPPIGIVADYELVEPLADGIIVVIRPDHTNRARCVAALKNISKDKLVGVITNCVPDWFMTRSRDHDYAYYQRQDD